MQDKLSIRYFPLVDLVEKTMSVGHRLSVLVDLSVSIIVPAAQP